MSRNRNKRNNAPSSRSSVQKSATISVQEPFRLPNTRQTQPSNYNAYAGSPIQIIPRRNIASPTMLSTRWGLNNLATNNPLRLLILLADVDPDISLAIDNIITLICNPEDTQIVGMRESVVGAGNAAPDQKGTANLAAFFDGLPGEIGGLPGLMSQATMLTCFTGFNCLEAVPGEPLQGLSRIWPTDSLTLHLGRDNASGDVVVYQRQSGIIPPEVQDPLLPGYRRLSNETFFWHPWQPYVDEPYGRAMFAPALAEVLLYLAMLQDLRDSVHQNAWPRLVFGFNWAETYKIAKDVFNIKDHNKASEWVKEQFDLMAAATNGMAAGDVILKDTTSQSDILAGGNFGGLEPVLRELRSRIVRACKQLPVMMAFDGGHSGEGHTSIEWQIQAKRLEMLRSFILRPICKAGTLHYRLQGLPLIAVPKVQKIRTTDALLDAQAEEINQRIAAKDVLLGWKSNEQAAVERTGSGPVANKEGDREALLLVAGSAPTAKPNPQQGGGTTQEETNAGKGGQTK